MDQTYLFLGVVVILLLVIWYFSDKRKVKSDDKDVSEGHMRVYTDVYPKYPTYWSDYDFDYYRHGSWRGWREVNKKDRQIRAWNDEDWSKFNKMEN
jgi:hypothetical protein